MPTKKRKRKTRKRKTMRKFNRYGRGLPGLTKSTSTSNFSNIQSLKKARRQYENLQKWARNQGHYQQKNPTFGNKAWTRYLEPSHGPANNFLTKKQQQNLRRKQAALEAQMLENERIGSKAQMKNK